MSTHHAVIAGAGIGGLVAALCLARAGWRVSLFERAEVLEEAGAGLQLSPNASVILRRLGVLERLKTKALAPRAIRIRRAADGATLAVMPLDDAERRWGAPYLLVHRADLQRALLDAVAEDAAILLRTGAEVRGFESRREQVTVFLRLPSGALAVEGDCLIGADGSRSLVREKLFGTMSGAEKFIGRTAWRALVEAGCVPPDMRKDESSLWLGDKAHLVHYPLRSGTVINVVAIVEDDSPRSDTDNGWSSPGDAAFLEARFAGWAEPAQVLLSAARDWRKWPLFDRDRPCWTKDRVALLGDAAHPMFPFLAQGAAQAIEDASALSGALSREPNVESGLESYAAARTARAARVQRESRRQGKFYHFSGPAACARDVALRALGGRRLLARYDWLYDTRQVNPLAAR